jgi:hypothetical protein
MPTPTRFQSAGEAAGRVTQMTGISESLLGHGIVLVFLPNN